MNSKLVDYDFFDDQVIFNYFISSKELSVPTYMKQEKVRSFSNLASFYFSLVGNESRFSLI